MTLIRYWQKGLLFDLLNQLPLDQSFLNYVVSIPKEKLFSKHLDQTNDSTTQILLAPFVYANPENQSYWIPLWIPLIIQNDQICLRAKTVLPWIPGSQFDPLSDQRIFSSSQHDFDDWLRFEYLSEDHNMICDNWPDLYEMIVSNVDKFSNNQWQDHLAQKGYHLTPQAFILPDLEEPITHINALQSHFAQIEEIEPQPLLDQDPLTHIKLLVDGQLQAIHTPIGSDKQSFIEEILAYQQQQQRSVLWYQAQPLADLQSVDLLIIDEAHNLSPAQACMLLAKANKAIFLGDNQSIHRAPSLGAVQEEFDLRQYNLMDDEILDQLQYKGMLVGTGNAFRVALANSAYQEDQFGFFISTLGLKSQTANEPNVQFIEVNEAEVVEQANGLSNPQEAQAIADWLGSQHFSTSDLLIVTPFLAQKSTIQEALQAVGLSYPVVTPYELDNKQFSYIIFSSIYRASCQRPFIFDQGEEFLGSILARTEKSLFVFGDKAVFDLKMHSPSGKLAKRFNSFIPV